MFYIGNLNDKCCRYRLKVNRLRWSSRVLKRARTKEMTVGGEEGWRDVMHGDTRDVRAT